MEFVKEKYAQQQKSSVLQMNAEIKDRDAVFNQLKDELADIIEDIFNVDNSPSFYYNQNKSMSEAANNN